MAQQLGDAVAAEQKQKAASAHQAQSGAYAPYAAAALDERAHFNGLMRGPSTAANVGVTATSAGDAFSNSSLGVGGVVNTSTAGSNHANVLKSYLLDQMPKELVAAAPGAEPMRHQNYGAPLPLPQTPPHASSVAPMGAKGRAPPLTPTALAYQRAYTSAPTATAAQQQPPLPTSVASVGGGSCFVQPPPGFNVAGASRSVAAAQQPPPPPPPPPANSVFHRASSMTPVQQTPSSSAPQPSLLQYQIPTGGLPPNGVAWSQYQPYESIWR